MGERKGHHGWLGTALESDGHRLPAGHVHAARPVCCPGGPFRFLCVSNPSPCFRSFQSDLLSFELWVRGGWWTMAEATVVSRNLGLGVVLLSSAQHRCISL